MDEFILPLSMLKTTEMNLKLTAFLILSILLSNCTIHKKRYSRGYTIERNNTFKSSSKKEGQLFTSEKANIEAEIITNLDSTLSTASTVQNPSKSIEKKTYSKTSSFHKKRLKSYERSSKIHFSPTKTLSKIEKHIVPIVERKEELKDNNNYGILGLLFFILSIVFIPWSLTINLSAVIIIICVILFLILFYLFTLFSFKEMKTKTLRNEFISILNFVLISILYSFFLIAFLFAIILSITQSALILLVLAIGILSILIYLALARAFINYKESRDN
jgi:hypothetical protein